MRDALVHLPDILPQQFDVPGMETLATLEGGYDPPILLLYGWPSCNLPYLTSHR